MMKKFALTCFAFMLMVSPIMADEKEDAKAAIDQAKSDRSDASHLYDFVWDWTYPQNNTTTPPLYIGILWDARRFKLNGSDQSYFDSYLKSAESWMALGNTNNNSDESGAFGYLASANDCYDKCLKYWDDYVTSEGTDYDAYFYYISNASDAKSWAEIASTCANTAWYDYNYAGTYVSAMWDILDGQ